MPITGERWYETDPDISSYYQGDVVGGVPVVFMPPARSGAWILLRPSAPVSLQQALAGNLPKVFRPVVEHSADDPWQGDEELVLAKATKRPVLLVTQTCDLVHRNFVQVAPVYSADKLSAAKQESLDVNEITYLFCLPQQPGHLERSFADLSQITSVHRSYVAAGRLSVRLSNIGRIALQKHLANFHGRPFGFSPAEAVPQDADYVCANCFMSAARVQMEHIAADQGFPHCPNCGENALWLKFK
jgi:hypothetical protein